MITYILTGGTIGSSIGADGVARPDADISVFTGEDAAIRIPYNILSENLDAAHLNLLIKETADVIREGESEGIIITHGSDTLQYTAAILDIIFGGADIPIVLVAANYVLTDPRSNGKANLYFAQRFIKEKRGHGVFICYKNPKEAVKIHCGGKLMPHEAFSDKIKSVNDKIYGYYKDDTDKSTTEYIQLGNIEEKEAYDGSIPCLDEKPGSILRLEPYPGMSYPEIGEGVKAVLLGSFHSGTIAVNDGLKSFLDKAHQRGIAVWLCGITRESTEYETISSYKKMGIHPVYDVSPVYAYCMLWLRGFFSA